jgi:two-component system, OmpR family, sensor histidine kinase KdpD
MFLNSISRLMNWVKMEEQNRPDPDAILLSLKEDEKQNAGKGRLKVFFGMAAGVGKTYSMLETAHLQKREKADIVIGYIETHKRAETEELVKGLEVIPRKRILYKSIPVEEFDIDAALKRKPEIILIDELAHTNASGSRHAKRYQDVVEILDNGISVYTTLNVQHLDSQADIVEKITGIKIRETVPDSIIDLAYEIELIDIPPEELLKRLAEGKVYFPEKAGIAAENFFKKANITALREIALNYTARRVGSELRDYVQDKNIRGAWKSGERLLVAVGPGPYSEYLIRWTRRMAFNSNLQWVALYVDPQKELTGNAGNQLTKNLDLARELGAEIITTSGDDIVECILRTARQENITQIVIGKPLRKRLKEYIFGENIVEKLLKQSGDIEIHVVSQPVSERKNTGLLKNFKYISNAKEYTKGFAVTALITVINLLLVPFTGYWTVALIYLLSIVLLSLYIGKGPVFFTALISALLWNFLFIPPLFTLRIGNLEDSLMFFTYLIVALTLGNLTSKLRLKESALRKREDRISALYDFSRALSTAFGMDEIIGASIAYIEEYFSAKVAVFLANENGTALGKSYEASSLEISEKEFGVADWCFRNKKPAGIFTSTLPESKAHYIPLASSGEIVGVLALGISNVNPFAIEQRSFLQNIAYQLSIRIERENLSSKNQKAMISSESERLYKILLNSVSHELRTPLTTITGASSSLLDEIVGSNPVQCRDLAGEIKKAGESLNGLVENLLDMSRIESGRLKLNLDWHDISDIIATTLNRAESRLGNHPVTVDCPDDMPLIRVDYNLIVQAVYCIVHNALVHTPDGTMVRISVKTDKDNELVISVEDDGEGLPEDETERLFDKFYHLSGKSSGGLGLGLSISRGIIELHGGNISAENKNPRGARFIITLPVEMREKNGEIQRENPYN